MKAASEIGKTVRFHRKSAGLTQLDLASMAGVGKATVFDIEKGKASVQFDKLLKILAVLNITLEPTSPLMSAAMGTGQEHIISNINIS
ncbi:MAG: helix-turn-helix transcriptional regulator [Verrucomicrobia bacterium]|nr:helix-turn-helix transcriptional regulator [Verrucomicrobiota bacterium]